MDGQVQDAKVLRSIPLLDAAALDAVRQWEFIPTLVDGVAVPVIMTTMVSFALEFDHVNTRYVDRSVAGRRRHERQVNMRCGKRINRKPCSFFSSAIGVNDWNEPIARRLRVDRSYSFRSNAFRSSSAN